MSPYSGRRSVPTEHRTHFAWARLNSDALFIALLAIASGLTAILFPYADETIQKIGFPTPGFYLRTSSYVIAGVLLIFALVRESIPVEVMARTILTVGVAYELFRRLDIFGFHPSEPLWDAVILLGIVLLSTGLRCSILLSKRGLVVHLRERNLTERNGSS